MRRPTQLIAVGFGLVALTGYTTIPSYASSFSAVACPVTSSPSPTVAVSMSTVAFSVNEPIQPTIIDESAVPVGPIAGFSHEQLVNAAYIMNAAQALGLGVRGQQIGVMTAMGESTLRVLDNGDTVGPDSRGLFQQRDNGSWGTYEDRMDPFISATSFLTRLRTVPNWDTLEPTMSAHLVQINADPNHYTKYWADATVIVDALNASSASDPGVSFVANEQGAS